VTQPPAAPRPRRFASLRARFAALVAAGLLGSLTLAGLAALHLLGAAERSAFAMGEQMARSLAEQMAVATGAQADPAALQPIVDFVHDGEKLDLEVIDRAGRIVADADKGDIGRLAPEAGAAAIDATLVDGRPREFIEPAHDGEPERHQVIVAIPPNAGAPRVAALVLEYGPLREVLSREATRRAGVLLAAAALLAALLLAVCALALRPVLRSVGRLRAAAGALAAGERGHRIGIYGADELGELARGFDAMADSLARSSAQLLAEVDERRLAQAGLAEANAHLEQRVVQRTALLNESNERLRAELGERERVERELEQLARFDPLTGLPNRALFLARLGEALARGGAQRKTGLMFIDLDRFKAVNDALGHETGDHVLQQTAARLGERLRGVGTVCRIGGDEFTVIVEDVADRDALAPVAQGLVEAFRAPLHTPAGQDIHLSLSIGISLAPDDGADVIELMKRADIAMYEAKSEGRNGYRFHSERMGEEAATRLAIEHALRNALAKQEFTLHYQPRISATGGGVTGMEALLRWRSALVGSVEPDVFIPVAEDTGLILEIGAWVIATAFGQLAEWLAAGLEPGTLAVNISARQLRQPGFAGMVLAQARAAGVPPAHVELELTESMLVADPEHAAAVLAELRGHGFGIAIDDFGKGHSSLMHLKRFPATKLKIDRAFVADIDTNPDDRAIAASIVALAAALDIRVTAEGVETPAQLAVLETLRCTEFQGFLFGKPASAATTLGVLERETRREREAATGMP